MVDCLSSDAGIPGHPVGDPVDELYEWQEAEAEAEPHETPNLDHKASRLFTIFCKYGLNNTCDMKPTPVILSSL